MAIYISPPNEVSPDGREIWDWAGRLSDLAQLNQRARELGAEIRRIPNECGSCQLWMTSSCPKEAPGTGKRSGYSVGPSCRGSICSKFAIKAFDQKRLEGLTAELETVKSALNGGSTT